MDLRNKKDQKAQMAQMAQLPDNLKLTPEEIKKFGGMSYYNTHYHSFDSSSNKEDVLNMVVTKHDCGCEVVTYDNYVGLTYSRNVYYETRIIKNKITKANNCKTHQKIVDKRKKLLQQLQELEDGNIEFIPRVVRKLNNKCINEYHNIPEQDIITQIIELPTKEDLKEDEEEEDEDEEEEDEDEEEEDEDLKEDDDEEVVAKAVTRQKRSLKSGKK